MDTYFRVRSTKSICILTILFVGLSTPSASSAATQCAFIAQKQSPVVELAEAMLLGVADAEWLERSEIDKVLAEQKLQTLFAPEATGSRSALGKILKADLIVVVRTAEAQVDGRPQKSVEVAVAQTATGLRLVSRSIPLSEDAQADAQALVTLASEGFAKNAQDIERIYAVPPFVSQDLTYENDHLKQAYSRLIEQALLDQPGTLVVELAEADSIAREATLAGADATLVRFLPLYLLGEYRHDGVGKHQQITISLSINRGAKQLRSERKTMEPSAAPAYLLATLGEFGKLDGAELPVIDDIFEGAIVAIRNDPSLRSFISQSASVQAKTRVAVARYFRNRVDFAQLIRIVEKAKDGLQYSPGRVSKIIKSLELGGAEERRDKTSIVERANLIVRTRVPPGL